jgi:general secretion pathway protein A
VYERYYGFAEKPFSLTPDPKYLYRSQGHASAFDLLQYAIRRREGFAVITGDIGTGKTTICRALLEQIDRTTFTALVLNPFLSEEDLLKRILQDFGVVSREEIKSGRLAGVSKQDLIDVLYDFLLSLIPLKASAVLIIDEAQHLPLRVLEQIRILSNLETDKEKLLQIILVGQLDLQTVLRSPGLRQLDQRISIRYELKPLDREAVAAYVAHRLTIAGGSAAVTFAPKALGEVHRLSGGIPRLINLICDRALLAGFSVHASRITPEMVRHAADSLDLRAPAWSKARWRRRMWSIIAPAAMVLLASAAAVGATAYFYERFGTRAVQAASQTVVDQGAPVATAAVPPVEHRPPSDAPLTILVGSYPASAATSDADARTLTRWLEGSGYDAYQADVDLGLEGRWLRVLAGAYTDAVIAARDAEWINAEIPGADARVVDTAVVTGVAGATPSVVTPGAPAQNEP